MKSMKKVLRTSWNGQCLDEDHLCRALLQYRNIPSRKDGLSPVEKLYGQPVQDTLPAHHRSFSEKWQRSMEEPTQAALSNAERAENFYNTHAHNLPEITISSNIAIQNPNTKLWDIYGIVTDIGPHRRYYVNTQGERVLVRNRRFLRCRIPASIPTTTSNVEQELQPNLLYAPRHLCRQRNPTKRLIEDPTWP